MSVRNFGIDEINTMALFANVLGVQPRDCIIDSDSLYFLVDEGRARKAIGRAGPLKKLQEMAKKRVRIMEHNNDVKQFIRNMVPKAKSIEIAGKRAVVTVGEDDKAMVIGKGGSNIRKIRIFLERNSPLQGLNIR